MRPLSLILWSIVAVSSVAGAGCRLPGASSKPAEPTDETSADAAVRDDVRGEGEANQDADWSTKFRPRRPKSDSYFFFDDRARQIERNLGI